MAYANYADLGVDLSNTEAALLAIKPVAHAAKEGSIVIREKRMPERRVRTRNGWTMGWCPTRKAWVAYSWSPRLQEHRGKVFRSRRGLDAYAAFLQARNWEVQAFA